jgi:hypothetical protein
MTAHLKPHPVLMATQGQIYLIALIFAAFFFAPPPHFREARPVRRRAGQIKVRGMKD